MIELLAKVHDCKQFDCTEEWMVEEEELNAATEMNTFLSRHALNQMKKGVSRTFILRDDEGAEQFRALGYYSTSVGHVSPEDIPNVVSPRMTIPVLLLLRLAIDKEFQGKGYGSKLFICMLHQLVQLATNTGIHALVLDPLNDHVGGFYEKFGLRPLPGDPKRLYIRVREVETWLK